MGFSTFSTGFSTIRSRNGYTSRNPACCFLVSSGQKCGHSAFHKKESRRFFFAFYKAVPGGNLFFSNLEFSMPQFSTTSQGENAGVENRQKPWFSTLFFPRLHPLSLLPLVAATFPRPGEGFSRYGKVSGFAQGSPFGGAGARSAAKGVIGEWTPSVIACGNATSLTEGGLGMAAKFPA